MSTEKKARQWNALIYEPTDQENIIAGELHNQEIYDNEYAVVREVTPESESELIELRKDKEMLEFMANRSAMLIPGWNGEWTVTFSNPFGVCVGKTPREAIRAAMAEGKK